MSERTDERTVGEGTDADLDLDDPKGDVDALTGDPASADSSSSTAASSTRPGERTGSGPGLLSRIRPSVSVSNPLSALPTARSLAMSLGVVVASMLVGGALLPLGDVGSVLGIFVGAFLLGVVSGKQRYLELVASGAVAAAISVVLGQLFLSAVANLAVPLAAVGAGGGAAAALLGHYFGRDLRDGMTREVDG